MKKYTVFSYVFVLFLLMFGIEISTIWTADDWGYAFVIWTSERISSLADVIRSVYILYTKWSGRSIVEVLKYCIVLCPTAIRGIFMSLVFCTYLYLSCILFGKKNLCCRIGIFLCSIFVLVPAFAQNFIWIAGWANYCYPMVVCLAFLKILYDCVFERRENTRHIVFIILGFLCGLSQENVVFLTGAFIFCLLIFEWKNLNDEQKILVRNGTIAFGIGALILLAAPGNWSRLSTGGGMKLYYKNVLKAMQTMWLSWIFLGISLMIIKRKNYSLFKILCRNFVLPVFISFGPMFLISEFPDRALLPMVSVCAAISAYGISEIINKIGGVMVVISCIFMLFLDYIYLGTALPYKKNYEEQIEESKALGRGDIIINEYQKPEWFPSKYILQSVSKCRWDTGNVYMAVYYGVHSITALPSEHTLMIVNVSDEIGFTESVLCVYDEGDKEIYSTKRIKGGWLYNFEEDMRIGKLEYCVPDEIIKKSRRFKITFSEGFSYRCISIEMRNMKEEKKYLVSDDDIVVGTDDVGLHFQLGKW